MNRHAVELRWVVSLLNALQGYSDRNDGKTEVNELDHSLSVATRALRAGADDELICVALLHDAAKPLSEIAHGEVMAEMLTEYVTPPRREILRYHHLFQGAAWTGSIPPMQGLGEVWYEDAKRLGEWDAQSFDPDYDWLPLSDFLPKLEQLYRVDHMEY